MSISNYGELAYLNSLRNTSFAVGATYVKLHIGDGGEDATANAAANTLRKLITFNAAASGSMVSAGAIIWTSVPNTETYTHWSLWDALTGGNALWTGALSASAAVTIGDTFQITTLTLSLD